MIASRIRLAFLIAAALAGGRGGASAGESAAFRPPAKITDGSGPFHLSRTANGVMAADAAGTLHCVYYQGPTFVSLAEPNTVYYRRWTRGGEWAEPEIVDDSFVPGVGRLGGRHPSLALLGDGSVFVAWQDHRHCTSGGSWIDNIEIYGDLRPFGGAFSAIDTRLTTTAAAHNGDNGFSPKVALGPDGRLSLAWHDLHFNRDIADIFLKTSNSAGQFDPGQGMESMRLTNAAERLNDPAYTLPDLAVDSAGTRHLVWTSTYGSGAGANIYYATVAAGQMAPSIRLIQADAGDYFDPPHIALAPNGDVWIAYGDETASGGENVTLWRRPAGQPDFAGPYRVSPLPARQFAPDVEIDSQGRAHVVWVDKRAGTHVYYGIFDAAAGETVLEVRISETSGSYFRPSLALDSQGRAHVLYEESVSAIPPERSDLWFATTAPKTAARGWMRYR